MSMQHNFYYLSPLFTSAHRDHNSCSCQHNPYCPPQYLRLLLYYPSPHPPPLHLLLSVSLHSCPPTIHFHSFLLMSGVCVHLSAPSAPHRCCWAGRSDSSHDAYNPSDPLSPPLLILFLSLSVCSHVGSGILSAWLTDSWTCGGERERERWYLCVCVCEREKIKE